MRSEGEQRTVALLSLLPLFDRLSIDFESLSYLNRIDYRIAFTLSRRLLAFISLRASSRSMSSSSSSSDTLLLLETAHFAAIAHAKQVRKNHARTPYINHPLDVARRIAAPGSTLSPSPPVHILQAAMLHDVVEDTEVSFEEI